MSAAGDALAGARLVPSLLVSDLASSLAFYQGLGFIVSGRSEDDGWAEVSRDGVRLWLHTGAPQGTPTAPVCSGTLYITPVDVEALADEWAGRVRFGWGPEVMPYGLREFGLQDPDGYWLAFAEPA